MFYEMTIAGLKRQLPLCKVTDDLYIAAFIMFSDVEITKAAAGELLKKAPQFDIMITAESKGIPLAYEMARQSGCKRLYRSPQRPKALYAGYNHDRGGLHNYRPCSDPLHRQKRG